jgi:V/A-type H+-transporting ATPase subunit D
MIRWTKQELRNQQTRLTQFERYLPTLQLKKAMLQFEVIQAQAEITQLMEQFNQIQSKIDVFAPLLAEKVFCDLPSYADVLHVKKRYENIAGVEIPILDKVVFHEADYSLFGSPPWTDSATALLRDLATAREALRIAEEKRRALEKELREVSIRVNLFEKILIPRAKENIRKIRVFLGDQQLAAVGQAKVAKRKIALRSMRDA